MKAIRINGHLGELIQGRLGPSGPVALVTLPARDLWVAVSYRPGSFHVHQPSGLSISREALRSLFAALGRPLKGRWIIKARMPIGAGAGASTATLLGIGKLLRPDLLGDVLERVCVKIEGASDPLLRSRPERILWGSRSGQVLQQLPILPAMHIVGGFPLGVVRTDPGDHNFPDVSDLIDAWPEACSDIASLGELVSAASRRRLSQQGVGYDELEALRKGFKAHGVSIAHTGTARGFILSPDNNQHADLANTLRRMGWRHVQSYKLGGT